jgi:hypothetical protein
MYKQRMSIGDSFFINSKSINTVGGEKLMEVLKFFTSDYFIIETYKAGVDIPYDWEIVKDIELVDAKKGWKEFCEMVSISAQYNRLPKTDMAGQLDLKDRFLNEIWTGKATIKEVLSDYEKVMTEATRKYYADHPNESIEEFIDATWNIKR